MCRRRSRDVRKFLESVQLVILSCYVSSRRQPRRLHELSYARFSKDSHLSPEEFVVLPPVSGFYCFFAMIVDARALCRSSLPSVLFLFRRVIFHRLSTPGQTRFLGTKSRNPIARAFHQRGIKRAEPSASALRSHGDTKSTKSSCHAPFDSCLIHGPAASSRLGFTRRRFDRIKLPSRHSRSMSSGKKKCIET